MRMRFVLPAVLLAASLLSCKTREAKVDGGEPLAAESREEMSRPVQYYCEKCNVLVYTGHRCGVSRPCVICRIETEPVHHIHNVTRYCPSCVIEVGIGHRCGETTFCPTCRREAGHKHVCHVTRFCRDCRSEAATDHRCGETVFCVACGGDVGKNHAHGITFWCRRCRVEVDAEHLCPFDRRP